MKKIAIITNFEKENALEISLRLMSLLNGRAEIFCPESDAKLLKGATPLSEDELFAKCKIIAVLGGDGTIISTSKKCAEFENIIFGINTGHLGYLSATDSKNIEQAAQLLLSEDIHFDCRYMLSVTIHSGDKETTYNALNEAVLSRGDSSKLMNFTAYSHDKTICSYRSDGIIAATPTGSTAYSLAAGGPVLSPDADVMLLTPICPHMLRSRSIVIPPNEIRIEADDNCQLSVDGQKSIHLKKGDFVTISKSSYCTRLVHNKDLSFYDILQKKLN